MIWPFIYLSYLSLFIFGLTDNVRGPLFPEILKEFAVSDTMGSAMFAISSASGVCASFFARHLLRRYNRRSVLQGASCALIFALIGLATSPNFYVFLFFSVLFGSSLGIIGLIPNVLVAMGSSPERKQQLLSGLHSMYGIASFLSPILAASVQYLTGSWRYTFAVLIIAPIMLIYYSNHKSHHSLHQKPQPQSDSNKKDRRKNLKPQLYMASMLSFCVAAEILISSRLALFMRRTWHYDMEQSSLYVTYFFISMLIGRLLFTVIKLKTSIPNQLTVSAILSAFCIAMGALVHPLFLPVVGFTIAPYYPLSITWISTKFPDDLDTAVSYMMTIDSVMLVVMHLGVGKLTDHFGIAKALLIGPVFLLISLILVNCFEYFFEREKRTKPSSGI